MSILEIVLYSTLGAIVLGYTIYVIVKAIKIKNGTWKSKKARKEEEDD